METVGEHMGVKNPLIKKLDNGYFFVNTKKGSYTLPNLHQAILLCRWK